MKKLTSVFMSFMLVLSFTSCGNNEQSESNVSGTSSKVISEVSSKAGNDLSSAAENSEAMSEKLGDTLENSEKETESKDGKTLVVYYSATNNTAEVAKVISEATDGELFEIQPSEPYTAEDLDWTNEKSRVCIEHDDEGQRNIKLVSTSVSDWEAYDTVYIGYPIWWGIAAWPVDNFIKANDFTDKTVIPFCTSASSELGESGKLLEEMAGTGNWQEGKRFQSGTSEDEVRSWVESLKK